MDDYERSQISDAFQEIKFGVGDTIIKEGDEGKEMYFLLEGEAYAEKTVDGALKTVKDYTTGDYFGELALLRGEPRAATVKTKTEVSCVTMDRHAFKRMLGPLEDILKRNVDLYTMYNK